MVVYKPVSDVTEIKKIYNDVKFENDCIYGTYRAFLNDECVGGCLVKVEGYNCFISKLNSSVDDAELVEGLIRSALHFASNRNAYMAFCNENKYKSVLDLLGFEYNEGNYYGDIPTLLSGSCCKGK